MWGSCGGGAHADRLLLRNLRSHEADPWDARGGEPDNVGSARLRVRKLALGFAMQLQLAGVAPAAVLCAVRGGGGGARGGRGVQ